jgi:hypothetical protein
MAVGRTIVVAAPIGVRLHYSRWFWFRWRIAGVIHPQAVVDLWYAQDCPSALSLDGFSRFVRVRLWVSRTLRR